MTDERFARLMAGLLAGDRSALREVYEAYAGLVYALALSITGRREDAEDVTSEVFLRLCDKAGSYRPGGPHKAWLMTITHHLAVDCVRLRERRLPEPGGEAPPAPPKARRRPSAAACMSARCWPPCVRRNGRWCFSTSWRT